MFVGYMVCGGGGGVEGSNMLTMFGLLVSVGRLWLNHSRNRLLRSAGQKQLAASCRSSGFGYWKCIQRLLNKFS